MIFNIYSRYTLVFIYILYNSVSCMEQLTSSSSSMESSNSMRSLILSFKNEKSETSKRHLTDIQVQKLKIISQVIDDLPGRLTQRPPIVSMGSLSVADFNRFFPFIKRLYKLKKSVTQNDLDRNKCSIETRINNLTFSKKVSVLKVADFLIIPPLEDFLIKKIAHNAQAQNQLEMFVDNNSKWQEEYKNINHSYFMQKKIGQVILQTYYPSLIKLLKIPCEKIINTNFEINSVALSLDGKKISSGSSESFVLIMDSVDESVLSRPQFWVQRTNSVAWSPDGARIASGGAKSVFVWDSNTLNNVFRADIGCIESMAWSPDSTKLVLGLYNSTIYICDITNNSCYFFDSHEKSVNAVAWSPDGTKIASGSDDKTICIWDCTTGDLLQTLIGHEEGVCALAWSPDSTKIVSGAACTDRASANNVICIWSSVTGQVLKTIQGHRALVRSVAWSPDNTKIASGAWDDMICIWDSASGELLHTLSGHTEPINSVTWNFDSTKIVSGSRDGTIRIWNLKDPVIDFANNLKMLDLQQVIFIASVFSGKSWVKSDMVAIFDTLPDSIKNIINNNNSMIAKYLFLPWLRIKNYFNNYFTKEINASDLYD